MEFAKLCLDSSADLKIPPLPESFVEIEFSDDEETKLCDPLATDAQLPFGITPLLKAQLVSSRCLTRGDDVKKTVELSLNIELQDVLLGSGYSIGIFPQNRREEVNELLKLLNLTDKSERIVKIKGRNGSKKKLPLYVPKASTPRILLESILEIRGIMKKTFLRTLAEYAKENHEKRRLLELCSREGSIEYDEYFLQRGFTLSDVLKSLPSCVPPLSALIENLPRLMPRPYSVASSRNVVDVNTQCFQIVFNAVVTPKGLPGVCSSWLMRQMEDNAGLSEQFERLGLEKRNDNFKRITTIPVYVRKPSYSIPRPLNTALILIAHGTGIAPFRAVVEELEVTCDHPVLVYYGCRYRDRDEIYKREIEDLLNLLVNSSFKVCYSRDRLESEPKYVQDLLYDDKSTIFDLIENQNALVYICGDASNMAKDVRSVLVKCLAEPSNTSNEEAEEKICQMEKSKSLIKDVWR